MILNHLNCLSPRKQNGIGTRKSVGLLKLFEPFSSFPTHIFVHEECRECNACKDFVSVYILVFLVSQICFFFVGVMKKKDRHHCVCSSVQFYVLRPNFVILQFF